MSKLYQFVSTQLVEAENEDEAKERFADHSLDFAANAECYEACERCLAPLDDCRHHRKPIQIIVRKGLVEDVKNLNGADYEIIDHDHA